MKTKTARSPQKTPAAIRRTHPVHSQSTSVRLKKIVVPIDFSAPSRKALEYAAGFARQFNAAVHVVHVVEPVVYPTELGYGPVQLDALNRAMTADGKTKLQTWAEEHLQDLAVESEVRVGRPHHEITSAAREAKADLIVIATHGYTGLKHVLLGSTAERVVRHAACPVLVVREHEKDFL